MRKKTVIRRMCKKLPLSPELMAAASKGEMYEAGALDGQGVKKTSFGFSAKPETQEADFTVDAPGDDAAIEEAFGDE